jgi:hypothetical protein
MVVRARTRSPTLNPGVVIGGLLSQSRTGPPSCISCTTIGKDILTHHRTPWRRRESATKKPFVTEGLLHKRVALSKLGESSHKNCIAR